MASSLEKLVENLYDKEEKFKNFKYMKQYFPDHLDLLCQKGYCPFEWVDNMEKLDYNYFDLSESLRPDLRDDEHKRLLANLKSSSIAYYY